MSNDRQFWTCSIGPVDRCQLPEGSDLPMREAVRQGFEKLVGDGEEHLYSGWGNTEHYCAIEQERDKFRTEVERLRALLREVRDVFASGYRPEGLTGSEIVWKIDATLGEGGGDG